MTSYAIFLRGVNVAGITVKSADLKRAFLDAGFGDVKTILASGNAVVTSTKGAAAVKALAEKTLRAGFGYDAWVVVLTRERLAELIAACPYPADDATTHAYVTLGSAAAPLEELRAAAKDAGATSVLLGDDALAWPCPKGDTLDSVLGKLSAKPKYKSTTTTRNLRTLEKVLAAAR